MAVEAAAGGANPWITAGAIGANALAGAVTGGPSTVVPKYQDILTQLQLGELPPELEGLDIEQLLRQVALSKMMMGELSNLPGSLGYDALSEDAFTMDSLGSFLGGMNLQELPGQIGEQVRGAYDESFDLAEESLGRQIDTTTEAIKSARSGLGLRGSTAEVGQIANALGSLGESRRGFAADAALGRAQGIQAGYGLQGSLAQGLASTMGNLMLGQRGQNIGLRGMADSNRAALLSDPTFQNLFGLRQSTGGQQQVTQTQYTEFD